ncbi:zinc-ribbon domain-containing protein [Escherichia coli]
MARLILRKPYRKPQALCPECHQALQVLKACGAVDFLPHGHGFISKKRVEFIIA